MIARILSVLFPPRLPGRVRDWHDRAEYFAEEQGWAGKAKRRYTGIERHWMEYDCLGPIQQQCLAGPQKKS